MYYISLYIYMYYISLYIYMYYMYIYVYFIYMYYICICIIYVCITLYYVYTYYIYICMYVCMYYIIILYYILFYYIILYHIILNYIIYIYIICICNFHLLAVRLFVRWRSHSGRGPLFARLLLSHGCVGSLAILGKTVLLSTLRDWLNLWHSFSFEKATALSIEPRSLPFSSCIGSGATVLQGPTFCCLVRFL